MSRSKKLLRLLLLILFAVSTLLLVRQFADNAGGSGSYDRALDLAQSSKKSSAVQVAETSPESSLPQWVPAPIEEDDPHISQLESLDLSALQAVNPDVVGWIRIPDTRVDYPLMQGQDNDYYLTHTWDGQENSVGSIFLEHRNHMDFTDFNTIVYGHNMNDGSMFAALPRFATTWYYERHPYVYILTASGVLRYEVFASYRASVEGSTYGLSFQQDMTKVNFLTDAVKNSQLTTDIQPALTDRILTLSTCSGVGYSNRWVVHARLKMVPSE